MSRYGIITQNDAKRAFAAAVLQEKDARNLKNPDVGDVLGCGEGTVRNRLDTDRTDHQPLAFELARGIKTWGPDFGTHYLMPLTGCRVVSASGVGEDLRIELANRMGDLVAGALVSHTLTGLRPVEAKLMLAMLEAVIVKLTSYADLLRAVSAKQET